MAREHLCAEQMPGRGTFMTTIGTFRSRICGLISRDLKSILHSHILLLTENL